MRMTGRVTSQTYDSKNARSTYGNTCKLNETSIDFTTDGHFLKEIFK